MKHLITIIGPTAIGKTAMAIKIAQHFRCEIISCDSRQFYREMSIGTAVPSQDELAAAPHHFIHNKSIFDSYTVGDFEKEAIAKLDELFLKNDFAVLVGGSGLYVDAVLKGLDEFPDVDQSVRDLVRRNFELNGLAYLQSELSLRDPEYFKKVDQSNPQRLMRALEVSLQTGNPYSSYLAKNNTVRNFSSIVIGFEADRPKLYGRINDRVDIMLASGLEAEARNLLVHKHLNSLQTVGYRELFSYFDGEYTRDQAIEEIKKNTRRFAKRQMTWFKKNQEVTWFDYDTNSSIVVEYVINSIKP